MSIICDWLFKPIEHEVVKYSTLH